MKCVQHWFLGGITIHGSAVNIHGKNIAFIGNSGYGKSTLAHYLINQGGTLLADDNLVWSNKHNAFEGSKFPYQRIWENGYTGLKSKFPIETRLLEDWDKYLVKVPIKPTDYFELDYIFVLNIQPEISIQPLSLSEKISALCTFYKGIMDKATETEKFKRIKPLVRHFKMYRLNRPSGFEHIYETYSFLRSFLTNTKL